MFKKSILAAAILAALLVLTACGGGKYSDIKDVMGKMETSMVKFGTAMEAVTDAPGAAKALSDFATEFQSFNKTWTELQTKYPELKDAKEPPVELKEASDKLQASSLKMMEAMAKVQPYAEDPAVLEAMSKLQGF